MKHPHARVLEGDIVIRKTLPTWRKAILQVVALLVGIAAYLYWSHVRHLANPADRMVPSIMQIAHGFQYILRMDEDDHVRWLVADAGATCIRLGIGFLVSVLGAFVLGVLMGCFQDVEACCLRFVSWFAKIPGTSVIAVIFVAVGTGSSLYGTVIAFGVLPILAEAVYLLVRDVPNEKIHKAYTLGASHVEVIWNVIVREILPKFIDNVRLQIGPAMVYLIAAESLCAYIGFGYRINKLARQTHMDVVFPYLVALGLFGFCMNYLLTKIRERACPWYANGGK